MNTSNSSPSENGFLRVLKALGNALLAIVVTPFMLLNEFRNWLSDAVYRHGFEGGIRAAIGGLLGFAAAGGAGYFSGWVLNWPVAAWLGTGVLSWFLTYWFAWPLFYLFPVRPAIKLAQLGWDGIQRLTEGYADKIFGGIIRVVSSILPGSGAAWEKVSQKKDNWVSKTMLGLSYPVSLVGSAYAGFSVYQLVASCFGSALIGTTIGVGAGLLAGLILVAALFQCIEYGKLPFVAIASGAALLHAFRPEIGGLSSLVHASGHYVYLVEAAVLLAFVSYFFPVVHILLSGGLIKRLFDHLKPLNEKVYDDKDRNYSLFFHNLATFAFTGIALWQGYSWALLIGLPVWALLAALSIVVVVAYLWIYDIVDHGGGTFLTGAAASLWTGCCVGSTYNAWGHAGGIWMAIPLGVLTALFVGVLFFPLAYQLLKAIFTFTRISQLGESLARLHKAVEDGVHSLTRQLWHVYDNSYRDRSGYQVWFLHAANIAFAVYAGLSLPFLASHAPLAFIGKALSWAGSPYISGVLSYILVGRFLQKSNVGTEFVGAISSLAFAVWFSSATLAAGASLWAIALVGLLGWCAGMALIFPIAYTVLRFPAKYLLASWSSIVLVTVHDFAWGCFKQVWDKIVAVYAVVNDVVFVPIRRAIGRASQRVSSAYNWLRDRILGRRGN